jgi:hypothetical protein
MSTIYSHIINYFENPTFIKIKNEPQHSIYVCNTHTLLSNIIRYIVCIVPRDVFFIGDTQKLSELKWIVLQTRTVKRSENEIKELLTAPKQRYNPKRQAPYNELITRVENTPAADVYVSNGVFAPVRISLLKNDVSDNYPSSGTVISAIETYNTMMTLI